MQGALYRPLLPKLIFAIENHFNFFCKAHRIVHYCGDVDVSERYGIIRKLSIFFSLRTLLTSFVLFGVNAGTGPHGGGPAHAGGQAAAAGGSAVRTERQGQDRRKPTNGIHDQSCRVTKLATSTAGTSQRVYFKLAAEAAAIPFSFL